MKYTFRIALGDGNYLYPHNMYQGVGDFMDKAEDWTSNPAKAMWWEDELGRDILMSNYDNTEPIEIKEGESLWAIEDYVNSKKDVLDYLWAALDEADEDYVLIACQDIVRIAKAKGWLTEGA